MEKPRKPIPWYWELHEAHPNDWRAIPDTRMPRMEAVQINERNNTMVFPLNDGMVITEEVRIIVASKASILQYIQG